MQFHNLYDFEREAQAILPPPVFYHISLGSYNAETRDANIEEWRGYNLEPSMMKDVSLIDTSTKILGDIYSSPIGIAPMGHSGLAHPDGELEMARGAGGSLYCTATVATFPMEEVMKEGWKNKWFQLYILQDRGLTKELVQRAEVAGYKAIVLTIDSPVVGKREPHFIPRQTFGNLGITVDGKDIRTFVRQLLDANLSWNDVDWLRSITNLPIVIKGCISHEDIRISSELGDAVWLSNHGGRQLDRVCTTARMMDAASSYCEDNKKQLYVDGGIRRGTDALVALAMGADAVFIGRPAMYGLAFGEEGVRSVIRTINDELMNAMALCGVTSISEINANLLV